MPSSSTSRFSPLFRSREGRPLILYSCAIALAVVLNGANRSFDNLVGLEKIRRDSRKGDGSMYVNGVLDGCESV